MATSHRVDEYYEYLIENADLSKPPPTNEELEQQYQYWLKLKREEASKKLPNPIRLNKVIIPAPSNVNRTGVRLADYK